MKKVINPLNFVMVCKNKDLLAAGWKEVTHTKGTCWFDVESDMQSRRVLHEGGGLIEVICYHIQFESPYGDTCIIGPFQTPLERHEVEESAIELLSGSGARLKRLVFHVDMFEFGTRHSNFSINELSAFGVIASGGE